MSSTSTSTKTDKYLRFGIIGFGLVVFFLLFFADKTNLSTKDRADIAETGRQAASLLGSLPNLADPQSLALRAAVDSAEGSARIPLLDSLVNRLEATGQYAHAAVYADQLSRLDSTAERAFKAGNLARIATRTTSVQSDSLLYRQISDLAMAKLERANELAPRQEETLLNLGQAYTESNLPANFMKGVLTIREVLSVNPDNIEANYILGLFSVQSGQLEKAEQRFTKVLGLEPDYRDSRLLLGRVQMQLGKLPEARVNLQKAVETAQDPELKAAAEALLQQIG